MTLHYRYWLLLLAVICALSMTGCAKKDEISERMFVGKWRSSKLVTPVHLYENGEWEIKKDDLAVLQYGTWQYKKKQLIWSFKIDGVIAHDPNAVLSVTGDTFQIREANGAVTTYTRLE